MLKTLLKVVAWVVAVVVVLAGGVLTYAWFKANANYHRQWTAHDASFPIPFPLSDSDLASLGSERATSDPFAGVNLETLALQRAIANGKRLVDSRLGCTGCHGADFGGKTIVDSVIVARWVAPNLTSGQGSVTSTYRAQDWDRAVRHGIRHNGESSSMPAQEFVNLSDHELSDVVAYIKSLPPVDRDLGPTRLRPVFILVGAFVKDTFLATSINHQRAHAIEPPAATVSVEYGQHLVQVCRGCHGPTLAGGKITGDPNMPEVANLTPHESGLKNWTEADFMRALREGVRKDGTAIAAAMPWRTFGQMRDAEIQAIYAYLRTVPPLPKGAR